MWEIWFWANMEEYCTIVAIHGNKVTTCDAGGERPGRGGATSARTLVASRKVFIVQTIDTRDESTTEQGPITRNSHQVRNPLHTTTICMGLWRNSWGGAHPFAGILAILIKTVEQWDVTDDGISIVAIVRQRFPGSFTVVYYFLGVSRDNFW